MLLPAIDLRAQVSPPSLPTPKSSSLELSFVIDLHIRVTSRPQRLPAYLPTYLPIYPRKSVPTASFAPATTEYLGTYLYIQEIRPIFIKSPYHGTVIGYVQ